MPHDITTIQQAVNSNTPSTIEEPVYSANGDLLKFPLAELSLLKHYDTQEVLAAVCDFVCFDADWMRTYLTRFGVMVRMSAYKKKDIASMEVFIEGIIDLVNKIEAADKRNNK